MAKIYHDRRMLKWLPFQSLTEQGKDILELLDQQYSITQPSLSEDQYSAMQYRFEEAFARQETITIHYLQAHQKRSLKGMILSADVTHGLIVLNTGTVAVKTIIDLT